MTKKSSKPKIDTLDKLAVQVVESIEDLRKDMTQNFESIGDRLSALEDRTTAVESKIAGVHRRIDEDLDKRKQHAVRLTRIEKHLGFAARTDSI